MLSRNIWVSKIIKGQRSQELEGCADINSSSKVQIIISVSHRMSKATGEYRDHIIGV